MLPKSHPTPRGIQLQALVNACDAEILSAWPIPTRDDFLLVGIYISLYSYIDIGLRRMIEIFELAGKLPHPIKGKVANLSIVDVEKTLLAMPDSSKANRIAFERIAELRGFRNLVAHFAIKRIPNEDAFVFLTKSARDYKREFGKDPSPGVLLTAVADVPQIRNLVPELERLLTWLDKAVRELEDIWLASQREP